MANDGTVEKDINLSICLELEKKLIKGGFEVIMTRSDDSSTESEDRTGSRKKSDLKNRLQLMSDYPKAIFVSIHLNKFTTSAASGSQVFYSDKIESSKLLADLIQAEVIKDLQPENRRVNKKATSSTYLLYNATVPAVLVECGFLSNSNDLANLKNEEYQKKLAICIYNGIKEFYSFKEK